MYKKMKSLISFLIVFLIFLFILMNILKPADKLPSGTWESTNGNFSISLNFNEDSNLPSFNSTTQYREYISMKKKK